MIREPDVHKFRHGNTPQDGIPQAPSVMCGEEISPIVRNYSHNWNKVTCLRCLALKKARSLRDYKESLGAVNAALRNGTSLPPGLALALPVIRELLVVTIRLMEEQQDGGVKCTGVGCNYMVSKGGVCNKCGTVDRGE